mmetsp:Transcript_151047/g.263204  ORF Transcript_151047/g.263204 Transcript_151047/m.263204 type:complete len:704 (+) Transcript_151047:84-2195(+)
MMVAQFILALALFQGGVHTCVGQSVTPFEKVIKLLEGLKETSEAEGKEEAKTYGEFSCFCKDTTEAKSSSSLQTEEEIEGLSATIELKTAEKVTKTSELKEESKELQSNTLALASSKTECEKADLEFQTTVADLSRAVKALTDAKNALESGKPLSFVSVSDTLQMAEMMGKLSSPKRKAAASFVQSRAGVDPSDPEYKFHAQDIIDTISSLLEEFTENKDSTTKEWGDSKTACKKEQDGLSASIATNKDNISKLKTAITGLSTDLAKAKEDLVKAKVSLEEDQLYLKDLTKQCTNRANDFDQRSQMRGAEVATLTKALEILKGDVESTVSVNERALVQTNATAKVVHKKIVTAFQQVSASPAVNKPISLLQAASASSRATSVLSAPARVQMAIGTLQQEGRRLNSMALISLSGRASADPFMKVKELIQKLIERLIAEASGEASKKGFCDTALAKAKKDRDFRKDDVMSLNADIAELEAKQALLENEIGELTTDLSDLKSMLNESTIERSKSKKDNMETIEDAEKGLKALNECIEVLKTFYRKSARALVQVSPVDADTDGPGFEGSYKGQQTGMKSVMGLLEVIQSDYERTIRTRTAQESKEHADFTDLERSSKGDISGKTTKKEMDVEDLETTKKTLVVKMDDLKTQMSLLDAALKELVDLNPMCVDTGMSYKERKGTREEEIVALKKALCELDADQVEEECK